MNEPAARPPRYSLTRSERRMARRKAREKYIAAGGDGQKAKLLMEQDPDLASLDPQTILLLLQIAFQLWLWWRERDIDEPAEQPYDGEP